MSSLPSKNSQYRNRTRRPVPRAGAAVPARRPPSLASQRVSAYVTRSLTQRWRKYTRELRTCQLEFAEESVHDLRVSIRRMVSTLDMAGAVIPDRAAKRLRRDLKRLLDRLNPLRDVQVQVMLVDGMLPRHPRLGVIRTILLMRERRLIAQLSERVKRVKPATHAPVIRLLREKVERSFYDSSRARTRRAAVIATATAAFANAVQLKEMADRSRPATIHRFRVAFKKFRYKAEMLQPLLPWLRKEQLSAMNAYQTRMGDIQDIEVFLGLVRRYAARHRRPGMPPFRPVVLELLARRRELIRTFFLSASELYSFWHITANAPHTVFTSAPRRKR